MNNELLQARSLRPSSNRKRPGTLFNLLLPQTLGWEVMVLVDCGVVSGISPAERFGKCLCSESTNSRDDAVQTGWVWSSKDESTQNADSLGVKKWQSYLEPWHEHFTLVLHMNRHAHVQHRNAILDDSLDDVMQHCNAILDDSLDDVILHVCETGQLNKCFMQLPYCGSHLHWNGSLCFVNWLSVKKTRITHPSLFLPSSSYIAHFSG